MKSSARCAGGNVRRRQPQWRASGSVGLMAICLWLSGCQSTPPHASWLQKNYRPDNAFAYPAKLSLNCQRVAVLPLAAEVGGDLPDGCKVLAPVLLEQLVKTKKFEVVSVDAATLRHRTGQINWTGAEVLPPDFLAFLRREYGCDGVLFAELTAYRAYAPLAVGWRLKLVDARSGQILWSADEMFDASRASVARGVQRFETPPVIWPFLREENWVALNSPSQLGRYSAAAVLGTLPDH